MYEERLEQELRNHFQVEVTTIEPTSDWWDRTVSQVTGQNRRTHWFGFMPARLAWVFVPLLILFTGGVVYAASSVIDEIFQKYTGNAGKAGLAQEMDLSQTINGVTVRLERAYADNNVVLLGYTVSGPAEYLTHSDKLTNDGQVLPGQGAMGFKPGSTEVFSNWAPAERVAVVDTFDTSSLTGVSSELNLNLMVPVLDWTNPGINAPVVGVFTFNFTVPVHPGIDTGVNQTATAHGISFTLQNVEISHYQTEIIFQPFNQDLQDSRGGPMLSLTTPSGKSVPCYLSGTRGDSPVYYFMGDFTGEHGEWTVTISELDYPGEMTETTLVPGSGGNLIEGKSGPSTHLSGPWVFHFKTQ